MDFDHGSPNAVKKLLKSFEAKKFKSVQQISLALSLKKMEQERQLKKVLLEGGQVKFMTVAASEVENKFPGFQIQCFAETLILNIQRATIWCEKFPILEIKLNIKGKNIVVNFIVEERDVEAGSVKILVLEVYDEETTETIQVPSSISKRLAALADKGAMTTVQELIKAGFRIGSGG